MGIVDASGNKVKVDSKREFEMLLFRKAVGHLLRGQMAIMKALCELNEDGEIDDNTIEFMKGSIDLKIFDDIKKGGTDGDKKEEA